MALFQTRQSNVNPNVQEIYNPQELGGRQAGQGFINTKELFDFAISQNLLGSRPSTVNPQVQELFDPKTGQGFTNELEAINFLTSLPAPAVQTTPVNVEIPETIPSTVLTETPVTSGDIATLVRQNQERMDRLMSVFQPTERETELGEELITRRQDLRRLNQLEREQVEAALNQPILESIGVGQAGQAQRTAAFRRAAIAEDIQSLTDELGLLQSDRQSLREALQFQIDQGRFDVNLALQLREANKQEQEAAKNFALENNITTPYYNVGGTIYNTSTGKPFTSEEEFINETGMRLGEAEAQGLVDTIEPQQDLQTTIREIGGREVAITLDSQGNVVNRVDLGAARSGSGGGTTTQIDPVIESQAQAVIAGTLDITKVPAAERGEVLARVGEIQNKQLLEQFNDVDFVVAQIEEAEAQGESIGTIKADLEALGVPSDIINQALRKRIEILRQPQTNQSFFGRLFGS